MLCCSVSCSHSQATGGDQANGLSLSGADADAAQCTDLCARPACLYAMPCHVSSHLS